MLTVGDSAGSHCFSELSFWALLPPLWREHRAALHVANTLQDGQVLFVHSQHALTAPVIASSPSHSVARPSRCASVQAAPLGSG